MTPAPLLDQSSKHRVHLNYNDGGRADAGYKSGQRDCVVRAICIAESQPYENIRIEMIRRNKHFRETSRSRAAKSMRSNGITKGNYKQVYHPWLLELGYVWVPLMKIGTGCKVHMRKDELPLGTIIVKLSRHLAVVRDHILQDTFDSGRAGTRCVYGYYKKFCHHCNGEGEHGSYSYGGPYTPCSECGGSGRFKLND